MRGADDPEKMLDRIIIEMSDRLVAAKNQVRVAIGEQQRLACEVQHAAGEVLRRPSRRARKSASRGRGLKMAMRALSDRLETAKQRRTLLSLRATRASVVEAAHGDTGRIGESSRRCRCSIASRPSGGDGEGGRRGCRAFRDGAADPARPAAEREALSGPPPHARKSSICSIGSRSTPRADCLRPKPRSVCSATAPIGCPIRRRKGRLPGSSPSFRIRSS